MELTLFANAKINLSLDITSRLDSGYHTLFTVMQSVTLRDDVLLKTGAGALTLSCSAPDVPTDARNTALKAAVLFCEAAGIAPDLHIHIEKRIPSQAGLGGGSADAAAVLRGMNLLYGAPLSEETLLELALQVGADVPFCLLGGTRLCLHLGEETSPLPALSAFVVIAKPAEGVSTGPAFRRFDEGFPARRPENGAVREALERGDPHALKDCAHNVFEDLSPLPVYGRVKRALYDNGAYFASLSGSGSAVFGLFDEESAANAAKEALERTERLQGVFLCRTAERGVCPQNG